MKKFLGMILYFLLSLVVIAKAEGIKEWKKVGGNPCGLPVSQVIDSLAVPQEVKDCWRTLVDSGDYEISYVNKGEVLSQLSFGGKINWTKFEVWDSTLCSWENVDSLKIQRYTAIFIDSLRTKDYLKVYTGIWELCVFDTCQNVGWQFRGRKTVSKAPKFRKEIILIEERADSITIEMKKPCFFLELEDFVSLGKNGHYGYFSEGARLNMYPCTYPYFGLSVKGLFSWMPPYNPDPAYALQKGVSFENLKENTNVELGIRLHLPKKLRITLYGYFGKQRYDYQWRSGLTYEAELLMAYKRLSFEQVIVDQSSVDYLWSRSRIKFHFLSKNSAEFRLGGEHYYEGNDYLKRPTYYYTRSGGLLEWFQRFGVNNWWSAVIHTGWGTFGWYLGGEFNIGTGVIPSR